MRRPNAVREDGFVSFSMTTVFRRETSKAKWGLVGSRFRGVNQRGEDVLIFSSVVLAVRKQS